MSGFLLSHLAHFIALTILLSLSAFFSGSETAFFSLSRSELLRFRNSSSSIEQIISSLMHRPRKLLLVLLLGNQFVNVAFFTLAARVEIDLFSIVQWPWWAETIALAAPVLPVILLGEVAPKSIAISAPSQVAHVMAVPAEVLVKVLGPVQGVLGKVLVDPLTRLLGPGPAGERPLTHDEMVSLLELSRQRKLLQAKESDWLKEVIELSRIRVADIMVPRVDMVAYDLDEGRAGLVDSFRRTRLVRIPVYQGDLDNVIGVVYARRLLLSPAEPLERLAEPVPFLPESATVDKLLAQLRKAGKQTAIVVDEFGGTAGLVTLEDALEEIVGDIDASGEQAGEAVQQTGPDEYVIRGDLAIHEWSDVFSIPLPAQRISTVGGWVTSLLGRVPQVGDQVDYRNLHFRVESMRGKRIGRLRVTLLPEEPAGEGQ